MAQINARDWTFEVDETGDGTTWNRVGQVLSFDLNRSEGEESTDTTTFDSEGIAESQAMQRGASLSMEGRKDPSDAGQQDVATLAEQVGEASLGGFRFRHKTDDEWTVWTAWVSQGSQSGGNNDKTSWAATFTRSGPATVEPVGP